MNYNDRKSYKRLPPKEKEAIDKAIVEFIEKQVNHEEAELQKIWISLLASFSMRPSAWGRNAFCCSSAIGNASTRET